MKNWPRALRMVACDGLLTACWLVANGYSFGVIDQVIHLPFLLDRLDGSLFPGDPLIDAGRHHPSLWNWLLTPLVAVLPIEPLFFAIHLVSVMAMFAGTRALARALVPGPEGAWVARIAPALLIPIQMTAPAIPIMDPLVLHRTVTLGPLLFAMAYAASGRIPAAFLLAGAMFGIHPTTASTTAVLIWFSALATARTPRALLLGPLIFVAAASPLLIMMLADGSHRGVPFPPPDDWLEITRLRVYFHLFPSDWAPVQWYRLIVPLAMIIASYRALRSRALTGFLLGMVVICVAGFVGIERFHHPTVLHLHPFHVLRFLSFYAVICGVAWAARSAPWSIRRPPLAALAVLCVSLGSRSAFLTYAALLLTVAALAIEVGATPSLRSPRWLTPAVVMIVTAMHLALHGPGRLQLRFRDLPGADLMAWVRDNVSEDAVIAVPPHWEHPLTAFRYGARRAIVGTFKDGGEVSFSVAYARAWRERMEALCACAPFAGMAASKDLAAHVERARDDIVQGYRSADAERFRSLARRFGATHAVVEKLEFHDDLYEAEQHNGKLVIQPALPVVYETARFVLYRIE